MHLSAANLSHFLMGHGLLGANEIVAGNVTIIDSSRRNRNFKVIRNGSVGTLRQADAQHANGCDAHPKA